MQHPIPQLFKTMIYRQSAAQIIETFQPNVFVTLAFNRDTTIDAARVKLNEFHERLDKSVYGRNWCFKADCRSEYIAVVEHQDTNFHLHIAFRLQPGRFCVVLGCASKIWKKLVPSGSVAVAETYDLPTLTKYMTKELTPSSSDRMLFSA